MKNYRVDFYYLDKETKEKNHLGFVYIDDSGVDKEFTLHAKAFRLCNNSCLVANKLETSEV